jgi:hypothetical protein
LLPAAGSGSRFNSGAAAASAGGGKKSADKLLSDIGGQTVLQR